MRIITAVLILLFSVLYYGCSVSKVDKINDQKETVRDNKYDTEFPSKNIGPLLEYISKSVKKLDVIAFYATYYFPVTDSISVDNISEELLEIYKGSMQIDHESVIGTASVIYKSEDVVGLLTCAHVVSFSDTIFKYVNSEKQYLNSISIKLKQQIHISGHNKGEPATIVAKDHRYDIAILAKNNEDTDDIQVMNIPIGRTKDLQWGSLVYIIGYPLNNLMVTRAIVSINDKIKSGFFVTDALYNKGISGSPVFAMRDGATNFELVGMAATASAQKNSVLSPNKSFDDKYNSGELYKGDVFVDISTLINYGITYSVNIDEIITFIDSNQKNLNNFGINITTSRSSQ